MKGSAVALALVLVRAANAPCGEAGDILPPVPPEAKDSYDKGRWASDMLFERARKGDAVSADEWEVAVSFFAEAQEKAPTSPAILKALALTHELRGGNVAAKAWFNAFLSAFPGARDRLAIVERIRVADQKAQVMIRKVFTEALRAAEKVPPGDAAVANRAEAVPFGNIAIWYGPNRAGTQPSYWMSHSTVLALQAEVAFYQADAGDVQGAFRTAKAVADGIQEGSWDRPSSVEIPYQPGAWQRRASVWLIGHDAHMAAEDWAGAMALYVEQRRGAGEDGKGALAVALCEVSGSIQPVAEEMRKEIWRRIEEAREKPVSLADWLALAAEVSKSSDEVSIDTRIRELSRPPAKPGGIVIAIAKTAIPIGRALLRVRALESRCADQALKALRRSYDRRIDDKAGREKVGEILAAVPELVSLRCSAYGETGLINAAGASWGEDAVELLLAKGADPNARSYWDLTALHYAAMYYNLPSARMLLSGGAAVNAPSYDGTTPLHEAASAGDPDMVELLLAAGADTTLRTRDGKRALDLAQQYLPNVNPMGKAGLEKVIELLRKAAGGKEEPKPPKPWWEECRFAMVKVIDAGDAAENSFVLRCVAGESAGKLLRLVASPIVSDRDLSRASLTEDGCSFGIEIVLTEEGKTKFAKATEAAVGKRLAIVSRGDIVYTATLRTPIASGTMTIQGLRSKAEAEAIVTSLNASE